MIVAVNVIRTEFGFWTHPQFPEFGERERVPLNEWGRWCADNGIKSRFVRFEDDAPEELQTRWFEGGEANCSEWVPTTPTKEAFLLSIHDAEDGPVAIFAIPLKS